MNLDEAVTAHQKWKTRLRMFINGGGQETLDAAVVSKDNQCDLGKWIHGPGATNASKPSFADLKSSHAEFHRHAGEIVKLVAAGDKAGAERALNGAYTQVSSNTVMAIQRLKKEI
jgi:chemoreceptor zinc-binding protein